MSWNPDVYLQFAAPRARPAADLLARVPEIHPGRVMDLGCGPGNATALLAARWPQARLEGLDSSEAMLAQARASGVKANWLLQDIARWQPDVLSEDGLYDLIFSNAAFQWLSNQAALLPRLIKFVAKGGVFAFQVPVNFHAASHTLMRDVASDPRWQAKLADVREIQWATGGDYYNILRPHTAALDIWTTEYLHVLEGEDAVYRWIAGTGLHPFVDALAQEERTDFIADYKERLNAAYPRHADGSTVFPFQRLFVVAMKA